MPPRALLFDFDGVLADTENIHITAWQRTFADLGWEIPEEVCSRAMEVDDRVFLAEVFAKKKIEDGDVDGWVRRKQIITVAMLADSPRVYPGVSALVHAVQGRVQLGVVTTTWRANVAVVLKAAALTDAFAIVVGKEDVTAAKPDPEAYRLAIQKLGVAPSEAVALEDSANGLEAARGAGIRGIAVGHRLPRGDWVGSATFVPSLARTNELLKILDLGGRTP